MTAINVKVMELDLDLELELRSELKFELELGFGLELEFAGFPTFLSFHRGTMASQSSEAAMLTAGSPEHSLSTEVRLGALTF